MAPSRPPKPPQTRSSSSSENVPLLKAIFDKDVWPKYTSQSLPPTDPNTRAIRERRPAVLHRPSKSARSFFRVPPKLVHNDIGGYHQEAKSWRNDVLQKYKFFGLRNVVKPEKDFSVALVNESAVVWVLRRHVVFPVVTVLHYALQGLKHRRTVRVLSEVPRTFRRKARKGVKTVGGKPVISTFRPDIQIVREFTSGDDDVLETLAIYEVKDSGLIPVSLFPHFWKEKDGIDNEDDDVIMGGLGGDDSSQDPAITNNEELFEEDIGEDVDTVDHGSTPQHASPTLIKYVLWQNGAYCSVNGCQDAIVGDEQCQVLLDFVGISNKSTMMDRFDDGPGDEVWVATTVDRSEFCINLMGCCIKGLKATGMN